MSRCSLATSSTAGNRGEPASFGASLDSDTSFLFVSNLALGNFVEPYLIRNKQPPETWKNRVNVNATVVARGPRYTELSTAFPNYGYIVPDVMPEPEPEPEPDPKPKPKPKPKLDPDVASKWVDGVICGGSPTLVAPSQPGWSPSQMVDVVQTYCILLDRTPTLEELTGHMETEFTAKRGAFDDELDFEFAVYQQIEKLGDSLAALPEFKSKHSELTPLAIAAIFWGRALDRAPNANEVLDISDDVKEYDSSVGELLAAFNDRFPAPRETFEGLVDARGFSRRCSVAREIRPVTQTIVRGIDTQGTFDDEPEHRASCESDEDSDGLEIVYRFKVTVPTRFEAILFETSGQLHLRKDSCESGIEVACDPRTFRHLESTSEINEWLEPGEYFLFLDSYIPNVAIEDYILDLYFEPVPVGRCDSPIDLGIYDQVVHGYFSSARPELSPCVVPGHQQVYRFETEKTIQFSAKAIDSDVTVHLGQDMCDKVANRSLCSHPGEIAQGSSVKARLEPGVYLFSVESSMKGIEYRVGVEFGLPEAKPGDSCDDAAHDQTNIAVAYGNIRSRV